MTRSTQYWLGSALLLLGIATNIAETAYFGWHKKPSCPEEVIWDYISMAIFHPGLIIMAHACWIREPDKTEVNKP